MELSPKYVFNNASITPSTVSGNTTRWNISPLSCINSSSTLIYVNCETSGPAYLPGDTVLSSYTVSPIIGDTDPLDNTVVRNDIVVGSWDPNYIAAQPEGCIPQETILTYDVGFENTGNDTAHNIFVLDTLSEYLDMSTFRIIASSAAMYVTKINNAGYHIIKFDFPGIMLPDSSHHDLCHGLFIYSIKTKTGIPQNTAIPARVGIYFDHNPVVLTNTIENIVDCPTYVHEVYNTNKVHLYPNPATNQLTIKTEQDAYTSFTITNSMGMETQF